MRRTWPDESERLATLSFTLGLVFAALVTLMPPVIVAVLAILYGVARMFGVL